MMIVGGHFGYHAMGVVSGEKGEIAPQRQISTLLVREPGFTRASYITLGLFECLRLFKHLSENILAGLSSLAMEKMNSPLLLPSKSHVSNRHAPAGLDPRTFPYMLLYHPSLSGCP